MAYDNIPEEFRPLDLSEGTTNSMGQPVVGGESAQDEAARKYREENDQQWFFQTLGVAQDENTETLVEGVQDAFTSGGNFAYDILTDYKRAFDNPYDPSFDPQKWIRDNAVKQGIDEQYLPNFGGVGSEKEANALLVDINSRKAAQQRLQRMGVTGQLTSGLIAGMVDVDTVLSAGVGLLGKGGIMATRMGRMMAGTATGTVAATAGAIASPENDWENVAVAALFSAGLSSLGKGGELDPLHREINAGIARGRDEFDVRLRERDPNFDFNDDVSVHRPAFAPDPEPVPESIAKPAKEPAEPGAEKVERMPDSFDASEVTMDAGDEIWEVGRRSGDKASVGARQMNQQQADFGPASPTVETIKANADQYVRTNKLEDDYYYDFNKGKSKTAQAIGTGVRKTVDALGAAGLVTDFDKLYKTGSTVAKMFAHQFLSDGSARLTNARSAVHLRDDWRDVLRAEWYKPLTDARDSYMKRQGISQLNFMGRARATTDFYKKVVLAQEELRLNGRYHPNTDPDVLAAATGVNNWAKLDVQIGRGNGSTTSVPGYETMQAYDGYFPRKVSSKLQAAIIRDSARNPSKYGRRISEKDVEDMWTEYYTGAVSKDDARYIARATMNRAKTQDRGADMNVYGLLQGDSKEYFEGFLRAQGLPNGRVSSIMRALVKDAETRGKAGHTAGRLDGDIRFQASNGLKVIDFVDTDVESILTYRSGNTAGRAAAAAQGIRTQQDATAMIDAILDQQQRNINDPITLRDALSSPNKVDGVQSFANDLLDKDRTVTREYLQGIMSQFMGGGVITGTDAAVIARMKRMTVLATMNGLGLTQLAETGALMGAVGWREFVKQLPAAVKSDLTNPRSALIQELQSMGKLIPEEHLYNPRYMADLDMSLHAQSEYAQLFDQIVGKGLQVQGIISGMNKVRYAQQKMAMMVTIDRLFQAIKGTVPDAISAERLAQIGIDPAMLSELKKVAQHVTMNGNNVESLNTKAWGNAALVDDFGRAMGIATDQLVQKARLGESNAFFAGNGIASMFGQFLSYPLTAITKQAARNAYAGDTEAMYQAMYGFVMAGMVGMSKAVVAGRYEDLNPVTFAKQGFVQANITGWVPLVSDPLMSLLGADSLKFNPYGDVIRTPPPVDVLNRTLKAPSSIAGILTGDLSKENMRNLRYLPLIGNWYGMTALTNRLGD
ncbi:putative internal virion protein [Rhizobium phage RHEph15]|nr:putative internal virion protein [Rhizobium phage RHEph15]QXV74995.1 putative internal virion protein [Rhizobium phage RHEph27]